MFEFLKRKRGTVEFPEFTAELPDQLRQRTTSSERRELLTTIRAGSAGGWKPPMLEPLLQQMGPRLFVELHDAVERAGLPFEREDWRVLVEMVEPNALIAWLSTGLLQELRTDAIVEEYIGFLRSRFEPWLRPMLAEQLAESPFRSPAAAIGLLIDVGGIEDVVPVLGSKDAEKREAAIEALVERADIAGDAVRGELQARRAGSRIAAAEVLRRAPGRESIEALEKALGTDKSKAAREAIQRALHECMKLDLPAIGDLGIDDVGRLNASLIADESTLPPELQTAPRAAVSWADGSPVADPAHIWILARLADLGPEGADTDLEGVCALLASESRRPLLDSIRDAFSEESDERRIGLALWATGYLGSDDDAEAVGRGLDEIARRGSSEQAFRRLRVLRRLGTPAAIGWLDHWAATAKAGGLRTRAAVGLRSLAAESRVTVDQLVERAIPDTRFDPRRLQRAMTGGRKWELSIWKERYVDDPLRWERSKAIVWMAFLPDRRRIAFRIDEDRTFADVNDEPLDLPDGAKIGVAHPVNLWRADRADWAQLLGEYELVSSFTQLDREVYSVTESEGELTHVERFVERPLDVNAIRFGLDSTDWLRGRAEDGWVDWYLKPSAAADLTCYLRVDPGFPIGDPEWAEPQSLRLSFLSGVHYEPPRGPVLVELNLVSREVFSEALREITALY